MQTQLLLTFIQTSRSRLTYFVVFATHTTKGSEESEYADINTNVNENTSTPIGYFSIISYLFLVVRASLKA